MAREIRHLLYALPHETLAAVPLHSQTDRQKVIENERGLTEGVIH